MIGSVLRWENLGLLACGERGSGFRLQKTLPGGRSLLRPNLLSANGYLIGYIQPHP